MSNSSQGSTGTSLCTLLAVLFVGLKLTNYIAWSWWWVTAPIWIPLALVLLIMIGAAIYWVVFE